MAQLSLNKVTSTPIAGTANILSFMPNADAAFMDIYLTSNDGTTIRRTMKKEDIVSLIAASPAGAVAWLDITGKPATYPPSAHSHPQSEVVNLVTDLAAKAPLASPALTGTPTAPTAAPGTNTTQIASTAFIQAAIAALVASSPAALDTLNELAAALGNDANFSTTITSALALKAPLASPTLTGTPAAPTAVQGTNTTQLATTAHVYAGLALKAPLASPGLTGTPTAPTAAGGTSTTQIATTAFVQAATAWTTTAW